MQIYFSALILILNISPRVFFLMLIVLKFVMHHKLGCVQSTTNYMANAFYHLLEVKLNIFILINKI